MKTSPVIGRYLIDRLYEHGVRHVFGIPGDYVLGFYDQLVSPRTLMRGCAAWARFASRIVWAA